MTTIDTTSPGPVTAGHANTGSTYQFEMTAATTAGAGRVRAALRTVGWWIVDGMATDNGWCWTLGSGWVPSAAYAARIVAQPDVDARIASRGKPT